MARIGLEIEVESNQVTRRQAAELLEVSRWHVESDGSLRGGNYGFELKFRRGYEYDRMESILRELYPVLVYSSGIWRAAVHCHVDASGLSGVGRGMCLAMACIFDRALFERHSPERVESNFSVPLMHKSHLVMEALGGLLHGVCYDPYGKYSSVNIRTLDTIGTIEFRHMRTPECDGTVQSVTRAIESIHRFASDCHLLMLRGEWICNNLPARSRGHKLHKRDYAKAIQLITHSVEHIGVPLSPDGEALAMVIDAIDWEAPAYTSTCLDLPTIHRASSSPPRRDRVIRINVIEEREHDQQEENWLEALFESGEIDEAEANTF